ncbi:MAG: hypothetical protein LBL79_01020 [Prevotella sp.]|jgi:hypothetical protein|nr:hypothetical protein [Prevotella sp.]
MKRKIFILICLLQTTLLATAQDHLSIKDIFDRYGKQEGSVLVQLASDVLSQGSNISLYKSLVMDYSAPKEQDILSYLKQDITSIISDVKKNGKTESGTYLVGSGKNKGYEYILYKNKSNKITVVYLKGNFSPKKLDPELNKLKDLFIYVNNKRLKIQ